MVASKGRLAGQAGVGRATVAKNFLSLVTLAATVYARVLGQRLMEQDEAPVDDGTTPAPETPPEVQKIQRQLKLLQYAVPAHVGGLIAVTALMSEQQRTAQVVQGVARRFLPAA
jgi:hypothetical protein